MKKILFIIQNGVGGAERMCANIANLLQNETYEIVFCKVSLPYTFQNGRIDSFIPKSSKISNILWSSQLSILKQFWNTIRKEKPDFVFSSVMPFNIRLLLLSPWYKNTKFIVRNDNYLFTVGKLKKFLIKYTYRLAYKIIAQTNEMQSELIELGLDPSKISVLQNFIDTELIKVKARAESPYFDNQKTRFVAVGRVAFQKGYDVLIEAFDIVAKHIPNAELYIVGNIDGSANEEYSRLSLAVNQLGLNDKVFFTGYTDNPYKYVNNADVYVLSSRYEGLPNSLIEADFLKIPLAAVRCVPIISRIIKDGVNGFLAENENPVSLADAMIKASEMKYVGSIYRAASHSDFIKLFN